MGEFFTYKNHLKGFTLIELLVVIAVIGLLSAIVLASLNNARKKARDTQRLADIHQIQNALELYRDTNGRYPGSDGNGCGGWSIGNQSQPMINGALNPTYMGQAPRDPSATGNCAGYYYYRYTPSFGYTGDCAGRNFYVLLVSSMESVSGRYPSSPGWKCPERDWAAEGSYVVGAFE